MDDQFINRIKLTKDLHIEMNKKFLFKNLLIGRLIAIIGLGLFSLLFLFYFEEPLFSLILMIFIIGYCIYPEIRMRFLAKKREKEAITIYNEIPEAKLHFSDENIVEENLVSKGKIPIEYDKIIKVFQTKNLYVLQLKNKVVVCVYKNGFEKGNKEDFERFIKEKADNAKIKL